MVYMAQDKKVLRQQQNVVSGSMEEKQYLDKLSQQIMDVNVEFVDFVAKGDASKKWAAERSDAVNNDYNKRLMMMITAPLRRGCNRDSILQTIGIVAGAMLFSKDFRKTCTATVQNMMYPYVQMKADKSGPNSFWARQRDKMAFDEKGRLPLTPESAAVMHLGFCKNAYNKMREPGANRDEILKNYKEAVATLHGQANEDGISPAVLNQSIRTIAGQLIERDPNLALCFEELTMRNVSRGAGKVDNMTEVWQGEYKGSDGKDFTGYFNPRVPRTADEYSRVFGKFFSDELKGCKTVEEMAEKMKTKEHKQQRDMYIELMMQDGIPLDNVQDSVKAYMKQSVQSWCDKNNIRTTQSRKGPSNQKPAPEQSQQQSKQQSGQGQENKKERAKGKPVPDWRKDVDENMPLRDMDFSRTYNSVLKEKFKDCKTADEMFAKLVDPEVTSATWEFLASGVYKWPHAELGDELSSYMNDNIKDFKSRSGTYINRFEIDGSESKGYSPSVTFKGLKLGDREYQPANQEFFDDLKRKTQHLAYSPDLRQSFLVHQCRNNMSAFLQDQVKDCKTVEEFHTHRGEPGEADRRLAEQNKYKDFLVSMGVSEQVAGNAMEKAFLESTAAWCQSNHVKYSLSRSPKTNDVMIQMPSRSEPVRKNDGAGKSHQEPDVEFE